MFGNFSLSELFPPKKKILSLQIFDEHDALVRRVWVNSVCLYKDMDVKAWLLDRLSLGSHEQLLELGDESLKALMRVAEALAEEERRETWLVRNLE